MYRTINEFTDDWRQETAITVKVYRKLSDASITQRVTHEGRSLGFIAWHIVLMIGETARRTGLRGAFLPDDAPMPMRAAVIAEAYHTAARLFGDEVRERWNDASLLEEVDMFGEKWRRDFALCALLRHQTHHRGQMTILMRQAGLTVPGVCGPSREEWAQWGMPAMK
ncbi:MAG TPA: DinB family protein [Bacteroidota bacterium]|nr:DinB family protein [Bacteroidota bacterium]